MNFNSATTNYTITAASTQNITLYSTTGTAQVNTQNGSDTIAAPVLLSSNTIFNTSGGSQLTVSGQISGSGSLSAIGSGTLILTGTQNYTGSTTVAGTLEVGTTSVSGFLTGTTHATVNSGGTLLFGGTSSITSGVTLNGGSISFVAGTPGQSATIGALSLSAGTTSSIDFGRGNNGITLTSAVNGGTIGLVSGTTLNVYDWTGTAYTLGQADTGVNTSQSRFLIGTTADATDLFSQVNFYSGSISSPGSLIGVGQEVMFGGEYEIVPLTTQPVPETSTWITSFGLLGLLAYARNRALVRNCFA